MPPIIDIRNFSKSYGAVRAVRDLSLAVERGELFGLIGPDGAGKTTTMRTLVTLLRPDAGELFLAGFDAKKDARNIRTVAGYMPQRFSLYPDLSVDQNLAFFADLFATPKREIDARKQRLYRFSRLEEFRDRPAGKLSGGMKQKLALSCTLIHDPLVLVLDEPTTGVDPISRNEFWAILSELKSQNVTILVSTPYMDEALLCDRVAIMHEGAILAQGEPRALTRYMRGSVYALYDLDLVGRAEAIERVPGVNSVQAFGDSLHVTVDPAMDAEFLRAELEKIAGRAVHIARVDPSLEDVFISLIREGVAHE